MLSISLPPLSDDALDRFHQLIDLRNQAFNALFESARSWLAVVAPRLARVEIEYGSEYGDEGSSYQTVEDIVAVDLDGQRWSLPNGDFDFEDCDPPEFASGAGADWAVTHLAPALGLDPSRLSDLSELLIECARQDLFASMDIERDAQPAATQHTPSAQ